MRKIQNLPHFKLQGFTQDRFGCVGIEAHVSHIARQVLIVGLSADHSTVVTAEFQRRHIDRCAQLFRRIRELAATPPATATFL